MKVALTWSIISFMKTVFIHDCHVLQTVKLPARDRYPETRIATLIQERSDSEPFNVVCTEECFVALERTDRDESGQRGTDCAPD